MFKMLAANVLAISLPQRKITSNITNISGVTELIARNIICLLKSGKSITFVYIILFSYKEG